MIGWNVKGGNTKVNSHQLPEVWRVPVQREGQRRLWWIWDSLSGNCQQHSLVSCNAVYFGKRPTFPSNIPPPTFLTIASLSILILGTQNLCVPSIGWSYSDVRRWGCIPLPSGNKFQEVHWSICWDDKMEVTMMVTIYRSIQILCSSAAFCKSAVVGSSS
jgi:hypothetical protein